jgi:hypothetical protein
LVGDHHWSAAVDQERAIQQHSPRAGYNAFAAHPAHDFAIGASAKALRRSLEIVHSPVWEPGVAASLLTVWSHGLNQDRGSVEDARLHKKVEIAASYQRFLIAPFALVAAGFGQ